MSRLATFIAKLLHDPVDTAGTSNPTTDELLVTSPLWLLTTS